MKKTYEEELLYSLKTLLTVHDEECYFDHSGFCQAHLLCDPCEVKIAQDLVKKCEENNDHI